MAIAHWKTIFKLIGLMSFAVACSTPSRNNAPDRNFYFEVVNHRTSDYSNQLTEFLNKNIPQYKYTITNHSGLEWPFYKKLKPDEEIPADSLMPPHWFVHKMQPGNPVYPVERDEFLVRIDLFPQPDTIPNYSVEIFQMDSVGLILSGQSGVHFIDSTEFSSSSELSDLFLKSVVRYSFK